MSEVINGAVTAAEEQVVQAGAEQETSQDSASYVALSDILSDAQDSNAGSPDADGTPVQPETVVNESDDGSEVQVDAATEPQPQTVYRTQADFDAAFSKRMANERARNRPYVEMGQAVMDLAGEELTSDEVKAAISNALAQKRANTYNTDFDTEMNNIRVEQRLHQRNNPRPAAQNTPQPAEDAGTRAQEMVAAMSAIGDEAFNVAALQGNQEAMVAWANGATPAEVYRRYFAGATSQQPAVQPASKPRRPAPERAANSGAMGTPQRRLTEADIRKIDQAIAEHGGVSIY